jgi:hypothetical protein
MLISSTVDARKAQSLLRVVHFGLSAQAYGLRDVPPATVASSDSSTTTGFVGLYHVSGRFAARWIPTVVFRGGRWCRLARPNLARCEVALGSPPRIEGWQDVQVSYGSWSRCGGAVSGNTRSPPEGARGDRVGASQGWGTRARSVRLIVDVLRRVCVNVVHAPCHQRR